MANLKKSSSATIIRDNNDLLTEVLIFLHAKSLLRLKMVSKHWNFLISDPSFCRNHALRHRPEPQPSLLLRDEFSSKYFVCSTTTKRLIPFHFQFSYVKILQSCNGLLLLECKNYKYGRRDYYVFNPTTMQYRDLYLGDSFDELFLAYDPSKSPHYKIFLFRSSFPFLLYDSETHTWKENRESQIERYKCSDAIICMNDSNSFVKSGYTTLYLFDNGNVFPINPTRSWCPGNKSYIVKSNGNMHCVMLSLQGNHNWLFVFEYLGECLVEISFSLTYRVDLNPILTTFSTNNCTIDMLDLIRGEREEDPLCLIHVPGKIVIYRFLDEICEVLVDFSETRLQFGFKDAHPLIESLAPV